jgi:hypothetical protein
MDRTKRGRPRLTSDKEYNSPHRRAVRKWNELHPDKAKEWGLKVYGQYRKRLNEYKSSHGCCICSEKDPRCLDFHHKEGSNKVMTVSQMCSFGKEKLFSEIEKCVIVCSNCHRKLTIKDTCDKLMT